MNEIKLVLHIDSSLPKEIQERLSSIRTKLVKKTDAEWQWTSACKTKIKTDSYFNKHDFYEEKFGIMNMQDEFCRIGAVAGIPEAAQCDN